jgi:hypothetical protein
MVRSLFIAAAAAVASAAYPVRRAARAGHSGPRRIYCAPGRALTAPRYPLPHPTATTVVPLGLDGLRRVRRARVALRGCGDARDTEDTGFGQGWRDVASRSAAAPLEPRVPRFS